MLLPLNCCNSSALLDLTAEPKVKTKTPNLKETGTFLVLKPSATPIESIAHFYYPPGPRGWEEMCQDRNENVTPSPITMYLADRLTVIGLVGIMTIN